MQDFYKRSEQWISMVFLLGFVFFIGWAVLVVAIQCGGWLVHATWQPVPFGAMFVSPDGQLWISHFQGKSQPFNLVPALGSSRDIEQVVIGLAGNLMGVRKIFEFFLETHFSLWLVAVGGCSLAVANSADLTP